MLYKNLVLVCLLDWDCYCATIAGKIIQLLLVCLLELVSQLGDSSLLAGFRMCIFFHLPAKHHLSQTRNYLKPAKTNKRLGWFIIIFFVKAFPFKHSELCDYVIAAKPSNHPMMV